MAQGKQLKHHYLTNTALPYDTNDSPTAKTPEFESGTNILTSKRGFCERRNGFTAFVADATFTFSGTLQRFYTWRRWTGAAVTLSGSFFVMYNDTTSSVSRVWKQLVGTDAYPSLIHTDSASANVFDFVVSNNFVFFGNGTDMKKYDGTTVTNWGITAPSAAVTFTSAAGSLSPVLGYKWVIAWNNSSTGHVSSPSPVSTSTTGASRKFTISGNTTTDTQVDYVRIFRTVDGGSIFFEHPSSPISYATWIASGFEDNSLDSALTSAVAPLQNQNNRPTASFDPVWFANRIWTHANDTLYYSDFEELVRGVEEESFASTNLRFFGKEILGKRVAKEYLLIFTADTIYRIYGDSLATFSMDTLARGKGVQNRAALASDDDLVVWLDSSGQVWATDGSMTKELSYPIRPDLAHINQTAAAIAIHKFGQARWILLLYDTDYAVTATTLGPLAYYRLGETSGTSAADSSGHGLTGTHVNTPTLGVTGAIAADPNLAITYAGASSEYTSLPASVLDVVANPSFSIACWAKPSGAIPASAESVFGHTYNNPSRNGPAFTLRASGLWSAEHYLAGIGVQALSTTVASSSRWDFLVATYDATTAIIKLYVNGQLEGSATGFSGTAQTNSGNATIGYAGISNYFSGSVDEVMVVNSVLELPAIEELYAAGTNDTRLLVYDLDAGQWMPPWPITGLSAIFSGQTAASLYQLLIARSNRPLALYDGYEDDGTPYTASLTTNLYDLVPEDNPSMYGVLHHVEVESNAVQPDSVNYLTDEDPSTGTFTAAAAGQDPSNRAQGTNLVEMWYYAMPDIPGARRVSIQLEWDADATNFIVYGIALAYEPIV